ncbi:MAG: hypothetical protein WBW84_00155 [Acidobacteriaceae bacterium]
MQIEVRYRLFAVAILLGTMWATTQARAQETIVAIRHAEKPAAGLGQLTCQGLNRALALPKILIGRYGRPEAIYAPDPAVQVNDWSNQLYSYVRPLMTIEPTAIALGMPVNAQIGFTDISRLQSALTAPAYAHALIFVAWEHGMLNKFAQQMLGSYGDNPSLVPDWPNSDYDRIYIFKIQRDSGRPRLSFRIDHEDLNGHLSRACPGPAQ